MALLGTNLASLGIHRRLDRVSYDLSRSFEALASGARINRAADDAAGLAISSSLRKDIRIYSRAILNVNDGISVINVAQGGLDALNSITMRQRELAEQAANGVYSSVQREALHKEANALVNEYNRIVASTTFNGRRLLDGSFTNVGIQAGYGENSTLFFSIGGSGGSEGSASSSAMGTGDGTFAASVSYARATIGTWGGTGNLTPLDVNTDGNLDLVSISSNSGNIEIHLGNGDGTFKARTTIALGTNLNTLATADLDGNGIQDLVVGDYGSTIYSLLGNGNGTFQVRSRSADASWAVHALELKDLNNDSILDMVTTGNFGGAGALSVKLGNGDGTFKAGVSYSAPTAAHSVKFGDFNGDGALDAAVGEETTDSLSIFLGNGNGTFKSRTVIAFGDYRSLEVADVNGDLKDDIVVTNDYGQTIDVYLGNGNGQFTNKSYVAFDNPTSLILADVNNDGVRDAIAGAGSGSAIQVLVGNADGSFQAARTFLSTPSETIALADFNKDGVKDIGAIGCTTPALHISLGGTPPAQGGQAASQAFVQAPLDLRTVSAARASLDTLHAASERIYSALGDLGSVNNRFKVAIQTLSVAQANYTAADSRIMDVDIAEETARVVRLGILQQAGAALLSQSNLNQRLVLQLLEPS